ncbi:MAG: glycosyltransferase family 2 protein [Chthonomonadales bacterium]
MQPNPSTPPHLSVIIPVFNERDNLLQIIERVRAVPIAKQIIIVDDLSTDGTREMLQTLAQNPAQDLTILFHNVNQGKGSSIRTAIPSIKAPFAIIQDGDLEYSPEDYLPIVREFEKADVMAVYGSRFLNGYPPMKLPNRVVNMLLAWMVRLLYNVPMTDEATCYKAFRSDVLKDIPLECKRFEFCPEVTAKLIRRGKKIVEVPIRYEARTISEGKKIRWTDGVEAIWTLIKWRFARF